MSTPLEKLQLRLAPLRAAYVAALPLVAERVRVQLGACESAAGLAALRETLHKLVGTAGTYGISEVALAAARLEQEAQPHVASAGAVALFEAIRVAALGVRAR
jgi:HPt (histidine-containing phosphotransfer) domain-containing protein